MDENGAARSSHSSLRHSALMLVGWLVGWLKTNFNEFRVLYLYLPPKNLLPFLQPQVQIHRGPHAKCRTFDNRYLIRNVSDQICLIYILIVLK